MIISNEVVIIYIKIKYFNLFFLERFLQEKERYGIVSILLLT